MTGLKKWFAAELVAFWMLFSLLSLAPVADMAKEPPGQAAPFDTETVSVESFHAKKRHLFRHFDAEDAAEAYREPENNYAKDGGSTLLTYDDPDNPSNVREYAVSVRYIDIT